MTGSNKPNIQDTFNAIAQARDFSDLQKGLAEVEQYSGAEKRKLVDMLEDAFLTDFVRGIPSENELETIRALAALSGETIDASEAREVQGFFFLAETIVNEKGDEAHPLMHRLVEKAAGLSDADYNDFFTVMKACALAVSEVGGLPPQAANALRRKHNGPKN